MLGRSGRSPTSGAIVVGAGAGVAGGAPGCVGDAGASVRLEGGRLAAATSVAGPSPVDVHGVWLNERGDRLSSVSCWTRAAGGAVDVSFEDPGGVVAGVSTGNAAAAASVVSARRASGRSKRGWSPRFAGDDGAPRSAASGSGMGIARSGVREIAFDDAGCAAGVSGMAAG